MSRVSAGSIIRRCSRCTRHIPLRSGLTVGLCLKCFRHNGGSERSYRTLSRAIRKSTAHTYAGMLKNMKLPVSSDYELLRDIDKGCRRKTKAYAKGQIYLLRRIADNYNFDSKFINPNRQMLQLWLKGRHSHPPRQRSRGRHIFSPKEIRTLLRHTVSKPSPDRLSFAAALSINYSCAARAADWQTITKNDIAIEENGDVVIRFHNTKTLKGNDEHRCVIPNARTLQAKTNFARIVTRWFSDPNIPSTGPILRLAGKPLTRQRFNKLLTTLCLKLKIGNRHKIFSAHGIKKSACSALDSRRVTDFATQARTSLNTVLRHYHLPRPENVRRATLHL